MDIDAKNLRARFVATDKTLTAKRQRVSELEVELDPLHHWELIRPFLCPHVTKNIISIT